MGELVTALRANDPDSCRCWLSGGVQDLGEPVEEELWLDWLDPLRANEERLIRIKYEGPLTADHG